ncbi:MAG: flippase-like domain-containing protein [Gemmatimonadota bacterium]|nr:flippase-like domain-containing protein [Gemmatimonadota bacterium]
MPAQRRRFGWPTIIGLLVTIPLLWWALRGIHFAQVWERFRDSAKLPLAATMVAVGLTLPARAARWRVLLREELAWLPFASLYHATAAGFAVNNLLPARAGEVARAYAARRLTGVRFSAAVTTIALSRVLDGVTLFAILVFATLVGWLPSEFTILNVSVGRIILVASVVFAVFFALALGAATFPHPVLQLTAWISARTLPQRWVTGFNEGVKGIIDSLAVMRDPQQLAQVALWSAVIWGLGGLSFFLAFLAFDLSVPWHAAFTLQTLINFGLVIPSTPGFVGVFEAVTRASLSIYGVDGASAVSYAVAYHFCLYAPVTLMGLWSLNRTRIRMAEVQEEVDERFSTAVRRLTGQYERVVEP